MGRRLALADVPTAQASVQRAPDSEDSPRCRDCADFGPVCPYDRLPCDRRTTKVASSVPSQVTRRAPRSDAPSDRVSPVPAPAVAPSAPRTARAQQSAPAAAGARVQSIRLVIEGEPIPKARARVVTSKGRDGKKGRTHSYTPKTTEVAENAIKAAARAANATLLTGDLRIEVIFYRSSARRCDVDNMLKTATDALNGVAYMDDSQITDVIARKRIDRKRPRTELVIESIAEGA